MKPTGRRRCRWRRPVCLSVCLSGRSSERTYGNAYTEQASRQATSSAHMETPILSRQAGSPRRQISRKTTRRKKEEEGSLSAMSSCRFSKLDGATSESAYWSVDAMDTFVLRNVAPCAVQFVTLLRGLLHANHSKEHPNPIDFIGARVQKQNANKSHCLLYIRIRCFLHLFVA